MRALMKFFSIFCGLSLLVSLTGCGGGGGGSLAPGQSVGAYSGYIGAAYNSNVADSRVRHFRAQVIDLIGCHV
jgi:hypothetical protein